MMTATKPPGTGKPPLLQRPAFWATIAVSALAVLVIPSLLFFALVPSWAAVAAPHQAPTSEITAKPSATRDPQTKPQPQSDEAWSEQKELDDLVDSCMAEKGYPSHVMAAWRAQDFALPLAIIPPDEQPALENALWGVVATRAATDYEDYITNGGCDGYAIGQLYTWDDH